MNYNYLIYILLNPALISCWEGKQLAAPEYYNNPTPVDLNKIQFNGYFTNISRYDYPIEKYPALNPVFFTPNNNILVSHGAYTDSALFTCKYYEQSFKPRSFGKYIIKGDTIFAFVPVAVSKGDGAFYGIYNLNFKGIIVNRNLITDWGAVPPFPKRIGKRDFEDIANTGLFKAHDLKFIETDAVKCLPVQ